MTAPTELDVSIRALIEEGLDILVNLIDNITKHGNYSPESTCTFIDQAGQAFREALRSLPASKAGWRDIESAPSNGDLILIIGGRRLEPEMVPADGEWWRHYGGNAAPTHWMPLPSAPDRRAGE